MVTENCLEGRGGYYCVSPSMPSYAAIYRKRGMYSIGHTHACFRRQMLVHSVRDLLAFSLTAPPTVCSYITPSPSAGPLPAFIGLFLSFSTLALHPTDRCLSPNHPLLIFCTIILFFRFQCTGDILGLKPRRLDHFPGVLLKWILNL